MTLTVHQIGPRELVISSVPLCVSSVASRVGKTADYLCGESSERNVFLCTFEVGIMVGPKENCDNAIDIPTLLSMAHML